MGPAPMSGERAYHIRLTPEYKIGEGTFAEQYRIEAKNTKQMYAAKFYKVRVEHMNP